MEYKKDIEPPASGRRVERLVWRRIELLSGKPPRSKLLKAALINRDDLKTIPFILKLKPPSVGYFLETSFQQFAGTEWFQWFGAREGVWHPWDEPIRLKIEPACPVVVHCG